MNAYKVTARHSGDGVRLSVGRNYLLFSDDELDSLIADLQTHRANAQGRKRDQIDQKVN